ncbi:DedA family protein [bacterium]|nr:DedA family protein [bacterium]
MHEILSAISTWFEQWGVLGLSLNACIESFFLVPPPDIILAAMSLKTPSLALWYAFICTISSAVGGIIGYSIGRFGGRPVFDFFLKKRKSQFEKVEEMYSKYGFWAVLFSALTPIPYNVFAISSGILKMDFLKFFAASFLGRGMRFFIVSTVIMLFGKMIIKYIDLIIVLLTVVLIIFFWIVYKKTTNKNA